MSDSRTLAERSDSALKWSYVGSLGRALAQLVVQVLLARILGPTAFGQAMLVTVVVGFGWLLADAGFGSALIQKADLRDEDVGYALGWVLLLSSLIGGGVVVLAPLLAALLGDTTLAPLLRLCGLLIPLQALSNLPLSLLRRRLDMKSQHMVQFCAYVLGYGGVGIALALLGFGPWSLLVGFAAQALLTIAAGYAIVRHTLRARLSGDRGLRTFGLAVMGTNLANWVIEHFDRAVVGRLWGVDGTGLYALASNLSRAPTTLLVNAAQGVVFASAAQIQQEPDRIARGFLAALGAMSLLSFPLFAFLATHAELVIHTLYGNRWESAVPLFAAFCAAMPFHAMLAIAGPALWALGRADIEMKIQLLVAVLLLVGLALLAGLPLHVAVWLIPGLYMGRASLVVTALGRRISLRPRRIAAATAGGLCLALVVVVTSSVANWLLPSPWHAALTSAAASMGFALGALRWGGSVLLGWELRVSLRERAERSNALRWACGWLRLRAEAPT